MQYNKGWMYIFPKFSISINVCKEFPIKIFITVLSVNVSYLNYLKLSKIRVWLKTF
jgi:hypothetical protein